MHSMNKLIISDSELEAKLGTIFDLLAFKLIAYNTQNTYNIISRCIPSLSQWLILPDMGDNVKPKIYLIVTFLVVVKLWKWFYGVPYL